MLAGSARNPLVEATVSVVIPAFNESARIAANLRETVRTLLDFGFAFEVIVVDDGSVDGTCLEAARVLLCDPQRIRVLRNDRNEGKGSALAVGTAASRGELIVFLDADMDLHPRQLPILFAEMRLLDADAVVGSKWHPQSVVTYPFLRRLYSRMYFAAVRLLFGLPLHDTQTGIKLFRARLLHDVLPRLAMRSFAFDVELLVVASHLGYRLVDAPVRLEFKRRLGRLRARHVVATILETLSIFVRVLMHAYDDPPMRRGSTFAGGREISEELARGLLEQRA